MAVPNRINFWTSPKGGGGVIFNPKIYVADFGNFKQGLLSMKLIQGEISGFRVCFFAIIELRKIKTRQTLKGSSSHTNLRDGSRYQIG